MAYSEPLLDWRLRKITRNFIQDKPDDFEQAASRINKHEASIATPGCVV
jgi:hypothetical protein